MELMANALLERGKYRIVRTLGRGGFGITYLAEQVLAKRKVCIKEFFPKDYYKRDSTTGLISLTSDGFGEMMDKFKAKFIKEAQTIAALDHPNIIHIHDVFEANNTAYYVMEYIEGSSLQDVVRRRGALPTEEALALINPIIDAVGYIHDRKIMHLDIKPGNIMVREKDGHPILIDFGLSKQYDESGNQTSSTPVGISHGFAPIEQYQTGGVSAFSPQTDIYSLGATLYYLVSGIVPPQAAIVANEGLPELLTSLSANLRTTIEQAMEVRSKMRPKSIAKLKQLLEGVTPSAPVHYSVTTAINTPVDGGATQTDAARNDATLIDGGSESVVKQEPEKKRSKWWLWLLLLVVVAVGGAFALFSSNLDITEPTGISEPTGHINGYGYVDLGLPSGLKWATCNVGASNPGYYGNYYAWGETSPKISYTEDNCSTLGQNIGDIAGTSRDAARRNWGGSWRMPRILEIDELLNNCTWTWTTQNGNNGYKVTGPNGNSIFLPAAGYRLRASSGEVGSYGLYWSSTPDESNTRGAYGLYFYSGDHNRNEDNRGYGWSVRPVSE